MIDFCLLGTSGMTPLVNRHLSSGMLRYNGNSILIDCGEGTQVAIKKQGWSFKDINLICLTHFHADHTTGLPGLLASMANAEKDDSLIIIGPKGVKRLIDAVLIMAPKLPFTLKVIEITSEKEILSLLGLNITAFRVQHGVTCLGYSFVLTRSGKFDVEMAKKNKIPESLWSKLQSEKVMEYEGRILTQSMIMGKPRKGIKLTYVTDSRPCTSIIDNAKDSDLFICEGMYGTAIDMPNAIKNHHMIFAEAAQLAKMAGVTEMWLTHYSPSINKPADFLREATYVFRNTTLGKDGMQKTLKYVDEL
jgi:ribonuclease Z